ncbi:plastocyanin/azurin family copper-binding protein [Acetobacterium bakii]|uniref:plastocyanin/azurin family copper-binding protein n=1 Tax=Acetobacterium bakii TaxID=52689 RepID=UPI00068151FF|nr:plastocyanin/azurin family copper-binding protein [Acetobacterium bakii]
MKKKFLLVFILVFLVVVFSACGTSSNGTTTDTPTDSNGTTTDTPTDTQPQTANLIIIENFEFVPAVLTVKAGDTVEWQNNDAVIHTVKFDTFESPDMGEGAIYTTSFDTPGTYPYICGPHPYMEGTIIVE